MATALTLTEVTPITVGPNGGTLLQVFGDFTGLLGRVFNVHVGPLGTTADPICQSGVSGQRSSISPLSVSELRCYLPNLEPDTSAYDVWVQTVDNPSDEYNGVLAAAITIYPENYKASVFSIRTVLPPFYLTGARNTGVLPAVEELP